MKLETSALIAEIVGSIAIVVTLAILILEVRGNTDEMRAATLANIGARSQSLPVAAASNADLAIVWDKFASGDELSREELAQVNQMFIVIAKVAEESYIAWRDGRLDDDVWQTRAALVFLYLQRQEMQDYWDTMRSFGVLVPGFVEYIDQAVAHEARE